MLSELFDREFLYTSGDGGYLSTTTALCNTRKYHGMYVRPIEAHGCELFMLLSNIDERVIINSEPYELSTHQYTEDIMPEGFKYIKKIGRYPWVEYSVGSVKIKKEMIISQENKNLLVKYTFSGVTSPVTIEIKPFVAFRSIHSLTENRAFLKLVQKMEDGIGYTPYEYLPPIYIQFNKNVHFVENVMRVTDFFYRKEMERGYAASEALITPGYFRLIVDESSSFILSCSLEKEDSDLLCQLFEDEHKRIPDMSNTVDRLHFAASQFTVKVCDRFGVMAGYPWFGMWGRDTFISMPYLYLTRGRITEYEKVLDIMIADMKNGLFYNTGNSYNTVDSSLWFFYALQHLENYKGWQYIADKYYSTMLNILDAYRTGENGITFMRSDSLLVNKGSSSLTWMDAIVDGKPAVNRMPLQVEINALWYNAISYFVSLASRTHDTIELIEWEKIGDKLRQSFKRCFWISETDSLADSAEIIDDETYNVVRDLSVRPNQIIATALPFIPLNRNEVADVIAKVKNELLTPYGLRTLSPEDARYIGEYGGSVEERDSAYHNGTVWTWLLGFYVEGAFVADGDNFTKEAEAIFEELTNALDKYGIGSLAEIYDGDFPHTPKGAIAQAWSVASALHIAKLIESRIY